MVCSSSGKDQVRNEVAALVEQAVEIEIDGKRVMPTLLSLHLSDDAATARSAHADGDRRSVWTTRVRAELMFHTYSEPKAAIMHWRLFNDVVLRARVSFRMLDDCTQHLFSPYQTTTSWHAGQRRRG